MKFNKIKKYVEVIKFYSCPHGTLELTGIAAQILNEQEESAALAILSELPPTCTVCQARMYLKSVEEV